MSDLRRAIVAAAILLLGALAATRLTLGGRESNERPAVLLSVWLPEPGDPPEIARRFAVPLESVARSIPGTTSVTGSVAASGVRLTVALERGTDPELAAARASAAMGSLRRDVPEGGSAIARPLASEQELGLIVSLSGPEAAERGREVADDLRALEGVRDVEIDGIADRALHASLRRGDATLAGQVGDALQRTHSAARLGDASWAGGDRRLPVVMTSAGAQDPGRAIVDLGGVPVRADSLATIVEGRMQESSVAHVDGRRAILLRVLASHDASLAAVDRSVRRLLAARIPEGRDSRLRAEIIDSDAEALARLFTRLALALAGASLLGFLAGLARHGPAGAWRLGLVVPLGLAAALNGLWLLGAPLDATTAPLVSLAVVAALPLAMARLEGRAHGPAAILLFAVPGALVPIGLHLAGGRLAPEWAHPAGAFATALALSTLATLAWGAIPSRPRRSRRIWSALRVPLSDPGTTLLVAATAAFVGFTLFGKALDPRVMAGPRSEGSALVVELSFPDGTTLARTERALQSIEGWLARRDEVERSWGRASASEAWCIARLRRNARDASAIGRMQLLLEHEAGLTGGSARVTVVGAGASASSGLLATSEKELPEADVAATRYRVIVSGPGFPAVRESVDRILRVASGAGVKYPLQRIEWTAPTTRVELLPRPGADRASVQALASSLATASSGPPRRPWPGREPTSLVVAWPDAPAPDDAAPQRTDLLERPVRVHGRPQVVGAIAWPEDRVILSSLRREDGRFVVPVSLRFDSISDDLRKQTRERLDTGLSILRLPDGCEIARPSLEGLDWPPERTRLLVLALLAPLALWLAGAFLLDSLLRALVPLFPLAVGVAFGAAALSISGTAFDGRAFTWIAAATCAALPIPLALLAPARGATWATVKWSAVRPARRALPSIVTISGALLLLCLSTWGLDRVEDAWVPALVAAAATAAATSLASLLLAPTATLALSDLRRRLGPEGRQLRHPRAWREATDSASPPTRLSLAVRHVTKTYGSGFRALHDVSFELEPGIVGLLGPNGAGKTTLLRIMTGLLIPTRGEVSYRGVVVAPENLSEYRRRLGFLPQEFNAYPGFSARQFLDYWAIERGMKNAPRREAEVEARLAEVGLSADGDRKVRDFSGGMRQRLGIARALLESPPLLIVDEPTTGLDVESRTRFRDALLTVAAQRLVLLSTHVASDVESTASRLLLLHRGRVQFDGAPSQLIERAHGRVIEALLDDAELAAFSRRHRVTARVRVLAGINVRAVIAPGESLPGQVVRPTLEEAYLAEIDVAEGRGR